MRFLVPLVLLASSALAQGLPVKSGLDTNLWTINSNKQGLVVPYDAANNPISVLESYLKVSQPTMLFFDPVEGTTLNTNMWTGDTFAGSMTLSVAVATGLTLNSSSLTTAAAMANVRSLKQFNVPIGEAPITGMTTFTVPQTVQAQQQIDFGFSDASASADAANGCFFRWNTAGEFRAYLYTNGGALQSAALTPPIINVTHTMYVQLKYDECIFSIDDTVVATITQLGTGVPFVAGKVPLYARVLNGTTPGAAPKISFYNFTVFQETIDQSRDFSRQMVSNAARGDWQAPAATFTRTGNFAASTAPTTRTLTATTTASETTLCGYVNVTPTTAAAGDYILFDYTVPAGFQLHVTNVTCNVSVSGAANPATALGIQWWVALDSTATTLATADALGPPPTAIAPRVITFGASNFPASAAIGTGPTFHNASVQFDPDLVTQSGRHFQVGFRALQAQTATASEVLAINCACPGWFE